MKTSTAQEMMELVRRYGLKPDIRRDISLLGYSVVLSGYRKYLPEYLGFTYDAFGVIWLDGVCWSILNADDISKKMKPLLKDLDALDKVLTKAMSVFLETRESFEKFSARKEITIQEFSHFLDV